MNSTPFKRSPPWWLLLAPVLLAGAWLRLDQISLQVIGDDEWHAVLFLQDHAYGEIFRTFGAADHSIPLTLLDKLVAESVGLSELAMRTPALVFGLLALILIPSLLRGVVGTRTSVIFAALLAISPLHIYFSRYARPYSAIFLFGVVGVLAFDRWWRTGRRRWAFVYAACAVLGTWFQPVVGPFLLAPFAYGLLPRRDGPRLWARIKRLFPLGLAVALGLAALVGPPLSNDYQAIGDRAARSWFKGESLDNAFVLLSGAPKIWLASICATALLAGVYSLRRRNRGFLGYMLIVTAAQLAALAVTRPEALEASIVLVRYTLPASAFVLLSIAEGLAFLDDLLRREWRAWPSALLATVVVSALLLWGPLLSYFDEANRTYYRPNSFTNHSLYQYMYERRDRRQLVPQLATHISPFYSRLALSLGQPGSDRERVVEAPAFFDWSRLPYVVYQRIHKRPVSLGLTGETGSTGGDLELPFPDPRFRFANFVNLGDVEGMHEQGVRWVVLHKHMREVAKRGGAPAPRWADPWIEYYTERFGSPCYEDDDLVAFDLKPKSKTS